MDVRLVERIKMVGQAMIDLQRDSNVTNSMGMNVASVQSIEQIFWDLIDEVNSDLDWLHSTSDLCFGWGPLPGGLGSPDGGFVSDWEDM